MYKYLQKVYSFIKPHNFEILVIFISSVILLIYHLRGFNPQDEAWILYGALRFFQGDIPYKDFTFLYTPGSLYLARLGFDLFGVSILSERIIAFVVSLLTISILLITARRVKASKNLTILSVAIFIFWGPAQTNFLWPVMIAISIFFLSNLLFDNFLKLKSVKYKYLAAFGILTATAILIKQNFGGALFFFFLIGFLTRKNRFLKNSAIYLISVFLALLPQTFYLLHTNSLNPFMREMYDVLFLQALRGETYSYLFPWQWPSPVYIKIAKIFFYFSPLFLFIYSLFIFIRKKSSYWQYSLLALLFYLSGVKIVLDLTHLTPFIAYSSVFVLILPKALKHNYKKVFITVVLFFIAIGLYTSIFKNYYKWFTPLSKNSVFWNNPKAGIWISENDLKTTEEIVTYINKNSKGEYFYNYGLYPVYYFLSETKNPTMFATINKRDVTGNNLQIYLRQLNENKPTLIMSDGQQTGTNPEIEEFINKNYSTSSAFSEKIFYLRK